MGKDGREGDAGRRADLGDRQFKTAGLVSGSAGNSSGEYLKVTSMMESLSIQTAT